MFENILGKKTTAQGAVISIEPLAERILFCATNEEQTTLQASVASYCPGPFDQAFYQRLAEQIRQQKEENPEMDLQKASLILPDQLFLLDMVSVPMIHRKAMQHSLSLAVEALYKNAGELNLVTYSVQQTKQTATFGLAGIRQDLLSQVRQVFAENGVAVTDVTFASNAMVNGAFALNPKLRNDTFLLLDIKERYSRFAFVVRGVTMGYYDLPFGYGMLHTSRVSQEHGLFDHRAGELLVLNAKERARAKQLTMEGTLPDSQNENGELPETETKAGRRLPKFMQRPVPETEQGFVYENFRIFVKWALNLISNNQNITSLAKLDRVYVNMPKRYDFLFHIINKKRDENGVVFAPALPEDTDIAFAANLELYGGFFLSQNNDANTF